MRREMMKGKSQLRCCKWLRICGQFLRDENKNKTITYTQQIKKIKNAIQIWKNQIYSKVIYIYIDRYIRGAFNKIPGIFVQAFKIVVDSWKFSMLLLYILWDDWPIFYDFKFKWTATEGIRIHSTKAWLSQLVNFQNEIWTWGQFRRKICNKIFF